VGAGAVAVCVYTRYALHTRLHGGGGLAVAVVMAAVRTVAWGAKAEKAEKAVAQWVSVGGWRWQWRCEGRRW
jgi:hypothetical protein